jgi:hypothetical protein
MESRWGKRRRQSLGSSWVRKGWGTLSQINVSFNHNPCLMINSFTTAKSRY